MSRSASKVAPDPMAIMDAFAEVAESFAGMRAQLIAQGFTEEQAGDLVVLIFRQSIEGGAK